MPRKWKTSDYDDDGYGDYEDDYGDHDEEEAYEVEQDYPQERPVSSSSVAGEIFSFSVFLSSFATCSDDSVAE